MRLHNRKGLIRQHTGASGRGCGRSGMDRQSSAACRGHTRSWLPHCETGGYRSSRTSSRVEGLFAEGPLL